MAHANFQLLSLTLLTVFLTGLAIGTDPGFRTTITNKGLDYGKKKH